MKRATCALLVSAALAVLLSGCGNSADIWQDEFDARLEGAAATTEEAREAADAIRTPSEYLTVLGPFADRLLFKSELVKELNPPARCEAVQVKGKAAVYGAAERIGSVFKDLTPDLEHHLPSLFRELVATIDKREHEAEACA